MNSKLAETVKDVVAAFHQAGDAVVGFVGLHGQALVAAPVLPVAHDHVVRNDVDAGPAHIVVTEIKFICPHHGPDFSAKFLRGSIDGLGAIARMLGENVVVRFAMIDPRLAERTIMLVPLHAHFAATDAHDRGIFEDGNQIAIQTLQEFHILRPAWADESAAGGFAEGFALIACPDHRVHLPETLQAGDERDVILMGKLDQIIPIFQRQRVGIGAIRKRFERHEVVQIDYQAVHLVARHPLDLLLHSGTGSHEGAGILGGVEIFAAPGEGGPIIDADAGQGSLISLGLLEQLDERLCSVEQAFIGG